MKSLLVVSTILAAVHSLHAASLLERLPELTHTGLSENEIEILARTTSPSCVNGTSYGTYAQPTLPSLLDLEKRNAFVKR